MSPALKKLARDMADAIAAAVGSDARVARCRKRARAAGFEMQVSVEAIIGFTDIAATGSTPPESADARRFEITPQDRRFLRSLRIASGETQPELE